MARIFTTQFTFNNKLYDAIITVISNGDNMNFHIKILDAELFDLIPDGNIKYEGKEGFKEMAIMNNQTTQTLMNAIAASIEQHLVSSS